MATRPSSRARTAMRSRCRPSRSTRGGSRVWFARASGCCATGRRGCGRGLSPGAVPLAGACVRRCDADAGRRSRGRSPGRASTRRHRAADRGRARRGSRRNGRAGAREPRRREPVPRTPSRRAHARALSVRAADRGARRLSRRPPPARRGARARPGSAPAAARARDPRSGPGARGGAPGRVACSHAAPVAPLDGRRRSRSRAATAALARPVSWRSEPERALGGRGRRAPLARGRRPGVEPRRRGSPARRLAEGRHDARGFVLAARTGDDLVAVVDPASRLVVDTFFATSPLHLGHRDGVVWIANGNSFDGPDPPGGGTIERRPGCLRGPGPGRRIHPSPCRPAR